MPRSDTSCLRGGRTFIFSPQPVAYKTSCMILLHTRGCFLCGFLSLRVKRGNPLCFGSDPNTHQPLADILAGKPGKQRLCFYWLCDMISLSKGLITLLILQIIGALASRMKNFLSVARRIFLAGTISLIVILVLIIVGYNGISYQYSNVVGKYYSLFSAISPIAGLLFWLISAVYIRKKGQSAAFQQTQKFTKTMGAMFIRDITSPFRLIGEQFRSKRKLTEYYSQIASNEIASMLAAGSKAINREKLFWMVIRFAIYTLGILSSANVLGTKSFFSLLGL